MNTTARTATEALNASFVYRVNAVVGNLDRFISPIEAAEMATRGVRSIEAVEVVEVDGVDVLLLTVKISTFVKRGGGNWNHRTATLTYSATENRYRGAAGNWQQAINADKWERSFSHIGCEFKTRDEAVAAYNAEGTKWVGYGEAREYKPA